MKRGFWWLGMVSVLAGCAVGGKSPPVDRFELEVAAAATPAALAVNSISVRAPSWLESGAMGYRLRYAKPGGREVYGLSRWVAPPSEMVLLGLKRALPQSASVGCRLQVELDEFVQDFSSSQDSVGRIEARVRLLPPKGEAGAVGRRFEWVAPAASNDAAGGAEALNQAMAKGVEDLRAWLQSLADNPQTRAICQG